MSTAVAEIRDKLRAIRDLCLADTKDLRTQLAEAEQELEQVDTALAAIGEKPSRRKKRKPAATSERRPCATKAEVLAVIHEILGENGSMPAVGLKKLAGEKLRERGKSLSMFAALFAKCLGDPSLVEKTAGSLSLTAAPRTEPKERKVGF
ncbi:hypothetical protein [Adhaeretor mobilis]|uniref:Uncharacterized protein n=1 Tax=Adhaeretor mobilis TaxID=1930276 RepID=A0A517MQD5_9BACT|nr:hypothetical protein [Adhaeretor mobilis]QDS97082.1 hypothetical protein HG15A2_03410 [Adhaeretor mobilis]